MSNPRTLQRLPVVRSLASSSSAEPNVSLTPWRQHPPSGFVVLDDHSLACEHSPTRCCARCADAHREIVHVYGKHYWMASEADFAELLAGAGHDDERGAALERDHADVIRAAAQGDAESLDYEQPDFASALEVHCERAPTDPPSAFELAVEALGAAVAGRVYRDEWARILAARAITARTDESCDHKEWGPACPFCGAEAMAIAPGKPGRRYLVIRFDVTDLTDDQIDGLAGAAIVQGEASDNDETPCGECEACLSPHAGEQQKCTQTGVNWPDVEAEQVEVLTCR